MNTGARLGLAVAAGYFLGRFHKLKWALAVASIAGRGRLPGGKGGLLQQGTKLLTSSPELTKLTEEMRGHLVDAGKAAAVAAVSSKINSLSDGLHERSEAMRAASTGGNGGAGEADEEEVEGDRHRGEHERYRDEDRAAGSRPKRHRDEDDGGRVPTPRRPASREDSDRPRASRQARSREERAAHGRTSRPPRHDDERDDEGDGARSGVGARRGQEGGGSRPQTSASRTGVISDE